MTTGDTASWTPLSSPPTDPSKLSALNGTQLFTHGRNAAEVAAVVEFLSGPEPAYLEIGFDHGMCLADRARRFPGTLQLGIEIRELRVARLRPSLPRNAFAWRADARAALSHVLPAGRLHGIYVLFPDPVWVVAHRSTHLLFSPAFVQVCQRALAPGGFLHVATDVGPYFAWIADLLRGWTPGEPPPLGEELSRRERVCRRDGLAVGRGTWIPPRSPETSRAT